MSQGKQKTVRRIPRWIWSTAVIALTTLAILELALRGLGLTDPVLYVPDDATGFRLKPNQHVRYLGNEIVINQWGVRDGRSLAIEHWRGRVVLVLGDSVTWGGIREKQENLFTTALEQFFGFRVINAAVNGYSVAQMVALYREHLHQLNPPVIIVYTVPRDFTRPPAVRLTGDSAAFPLEKPRLALPVALSIARLKAHQRWGWFAPEAAAVPIEDLTEEQCLQRNLDALTAVAGDIPPNTRLWVVVSPSHPGIPSDSLPKEVPDTLERHGIDLIDLSNAYGVTEDMFVDDVHLSTKGHAWVARRLRIEFAKFPFPSPK